LRQASALGEQVNDFFDYPGTAGASAAPPAGVILAGCTDREWAAFERHCSREAVRRGQALVRAGAVDRSLYVVLSGAFTVQGEGLPATAVPILPGEVIGEVAFFDGRPRSATVLATADAEVLHLTFDAYEALAATEPALVQRLLMDLGRALAARLRAVEAARNLR
jgi:CRP-like cAMP-binding protein